MALKEDTRDWVMALFSSRKVRSWKEFLSIKEEFTDRWVFRGQPDDWDLKSSLERCYEDFCIDLRRAPAIEKNLIRDFRRGYSANDREIVINDTLYCIALMQHHGAPTRLLDWTYSAYIALFFALAAECRSPVLWCLNGNWCLRQAKIIAGRAAILKRNADETRNEKTYASLYDADPPNQMVFLENPFLLNKRLIFQRGVFLCPGDISVPFEDNLKAMSGWNKRTSIRKLVLDLTDRNRRKILSELNDMNIHHGSLFQDFDAYAQGFWQRLPFYQNMVKKRTVT